MSKSNQSWQSLQGAAISLGTENAVEWLRFALPYIEERERELCAALLVNDWESATICARKTLSSIRLYGSLRLETLLYQVWNVHEPGTDVAAFQNELSTELQDVIDTIHIWLALHRERLVS